MSTIHNRSRESNQGSQNKNQSMEKVTKMRIRRPEHTETQSHRSARETKSRIEGQGSRNAAPEVSGRGKGNEHEGILIPFNPEPTGSSGLLSDRTFSLASKPLERTLIILQIWFKGRKALAVVLLRYVERESA